MNREGVLLVMFDLPQNAKDERRDYSKFVRKLKKEGFVMFQESVYIKHLRNLTSVVNEEQKLNDIAPQSGNVVALKLTLSQFKSLDVIRGSGESVHRIYAPALFF